MALRIPRVVTQQFPPVIAEIIDCLTSLCASNDKDFLGGEVLAVLKHRIKELRRRAEEADREAGEERRSG